MKTAPWLLVLLLPGVSFASGGTGDGPSLVSTIGTAIIAASLLTVIFNRFKLPALLAYIVSGLIIGALAANYFGATLHLMREVAHLGVVFLLFILGMEMDPTAVRLIGWRTAIAIALQAPITIGTVFLVQWLCHKYGATIPGLASNPDGWIYYAVAASVGSTAVVVKLLSDQFDLGSQAGKLTVLALIMEDAWAIGALSYVQSSGDTEFTMPAWLMITGGIALTVGAIFFSRYVLSRILANLSRYPELVMLVSIGWCFMCAELFAQLHLSAEVGALVAGLTVGRLPQHTEVFSRAVSLRDFFMALYFVALGISLPPPTWDVLASGSALVAIIILTRLLLFAPLLLAARQGPIISFTVPLNLCQLSVFSLIVMSVGVANGHLTTHDQMVMSYGLLIGDVLAVFFIRYNYRLAIFLSRLLGFRSGINRKSLGRERDSSEKPEIIMLGLFINAQAIVRYIEKTDPSLFDKMLIIDFNLAQHKRLSNPKLKVVYGDFSNPNTLRHYGIASAKVVISTISNAFLHGTRNEALINQIRMMNPRVQIVTTAMSSVQGDNLVKQGAFACISTPDESAPAYTNAVYAALAAYERDAIFDEGQSDAAAEETSTKPQAAGT